MDLGQSISLAALSANPYPIYKQLRNTETVVWVDAVNRWLVTRWEDVVLVDTHPEIFSAMESGSLQTKVMGRTMLRSDGKAHERLRKASEAVLPILFSRLPALRLNLDQPPEFRGWVFRGATHLHLQWEPSL